MHARTVDSWKGISSATLFDAGITRSGNLVEIPYFDERGHPYATRMVKSSGRRWWRPAGKSVILYGLRELPNRHHQDDIVFLCEGESDALALRDSIASLDDRRVFSLGIPGASTWKSAWRSYLTPFPTVYVCGDGDAAGAKMVGRVLADVPWARPVWMPPGEDARSILQSDPDRFLDLIAVADAAALRYAALVLAPTLNEYLALTGGGLDA